MEYVLWVILKGILLPYCLVTTTTKLKVLHDRGSRE